MRIKSKWFKNGREHTPQELAGAVSFVVWRIADNALKNTRKANFDVEVLVADRIAFRRLSQEARFAFTSTLANRVAETLAENQSRLLGGSQHESKRQFIDLLNQRADGYADFDYDEDGPSFRFTRYLGYCMNQVMSEKDSGWIIDQMISIEAPGAVEMVEKTMHNLLTTPNRVSTDIC